MPENPTTSFGNPMSPGGAGARNRGGASSAALAASGSFASRGSAPKPATAIKRSDARAGWRGFCCNRTPRDTREPPPARLLRSPPLDGVSLASVVMQLNPRPDEVKKNVPIESCLFQAKVVAPLRRAGLRVRLWRGITDGLTVPPLYLQTWAPAARLLTEAARLGKQLPLCGAAVAAADVAANARALEASGVSVRGVPASELEIPPAPAEEGGAALAARCTAGKPVDAYVRLSAPYTEEPALQPLFAKQPSTGGLLTEAQAVQMLLSIIAADPDECGGAGLSLAELALPVTLFAPGIDKSKCLLTKWYVVHTDEGRARLAAEWHALAPPWNPPVTALREYLGETVAFFFAFFGFISKWLLAPAILGTAVFGNQVATGNYATVYLPVRGAPRRRPRPRARLRRRHAPRPRAGVRHAREHLGVAAARLLGPRGEAAGAGVGCCRLHQPGGAPPAPQRGAARPLARLRAPTRPPARARLPLRAARRRCGRSLWRGRKRCGRPSTARRPFISRLFPRPRAAWLRRP